MRIDKSNSIYNDNGYMTNSIVSASTKRNNKWIRGSMRAYINYADTSIATKFIIKIQAFIRYKIQCNRCPKVFVASDD